MSSTTQSPSAWSQQVQFILKELRETLRDSRTIVTLLVMPVILYPLLGLGLRLLAFDEEHSQETPEYRVMLSTEQEAQWLNESLEASARLTSEPESESAPAIAIWVPNNDDEYDLSELVSTNQADLGLRVTPTDKPSIANQPSMEVELIRRDGSERSRDAADFIRKRLELLNSALVSVWAETKQESFEFPIRQSETTVEAPSDSSAILSLLPLVLLLMTVTGGVYPAIDLTAGERERDTLETLMALPVAPFRLLLAKYAAVVTVTLLTGAVNLIAMFVTVYALQLETVLFGEQGLTLMLGVKLAIVLAVFGLFYSALLLALTGSARSFKEAQAYLIPLMLLSISPALVILMPGWTLNNATAVVPLVNMLLLAREVLEANSSTELAPVIAAVASTGLYALACLAWAGKVFGSDAVSSGAQGSLKELFKRPQQFVATPSPQLALTVLSLLFPLYFIASGLLARASDASISYRLGVSAGLTVLLFAVIPWLTSRYCKVNLPSGFRINKASGLTLFGAVLLGVSAWPMAFEVVVVLQSFGWGRLSEAKLELVEKLLEQWRSAPVFWIVVTMGVIPGVCEELFFRGFLFSGVRKQFGNLQTVLITAVAFGFFHVVLAGGAAPERIVPSTLMGILLGWVALRAGSVIPSIIIHVLHNSLLVTMARYRDELAGWQTGLTETEHLPALWLAAAAAGIIVGVILIWMSARDVKEPSPELALS